MATARRRTLKAPADVSGTGLHTGSASVARLLPAASGAGIVFRRVDLAEPVTLPATLDHVGAVERRTALGDEATGIQLVEHVLAAIAAHQLDDVTIEVDGPEPPIGDGSLAPYVDAIAKAGTVEHDGEPVTITVGAPLTVSEGDARYVVAPADAASLTVTIEWEHPLIGRQSGRFDLTTDAITRELARARTFGFVAEHDSLRAAGLGLGATKDNVIALTDKGLAHGKLRWPDEFVRHKAVDLLGDLTLLGGRLGVDVIAFRPSHAGNLALARAIRRVGGVHAAPVMGIDEILGIIPHRYPMLLVDRILEIHGRERIVGIKNVTANEPFFQGHFPGHPIMPGVLIIEAMAQVGGMLLMGTVDDPESKVVYFMAIDGVKFRRPVVPGDQIRFELEMLQLRGRNCRMRGVGYVDGRPVAEAEMMARIVDK
ncbi:MAG TPA: UDP-3-O-acyl-N-acetylglucosamine deacetylase [Gemmatimonadales bacterium]|nr:UDP-3-O-acyl-N-acetylglucosamine deacetylase [Gemmatimonadales bacterium]